MPTELVFIWFISDNFSTELVKKCEKVIGRTTWTDNDKDEEKPDLGVKKIMIRNSNIQ